MNIAILSPNKNAYSETFIQAHKNNLKGSVFFYYDGQIPSKLEGFGSIIVKYGSLKKRLSLIENGVKLHSLGKSFKKNRVDVVLAQYGTTGSAVADLCKKLNIPLVTHFHGYDASVNHVILANNSYKLLFEIASKIVVVSKEMVNKMLLLDCPKTKIVYNTYGPNTAFFNVKPFYNSQQFIAVGRFTDKKAPYYTILAFSKVVARYPDATLIMAGSGELLNTCINLVKHLKLETSVNFAGVISQSKFMEYLQTSMAFVQHSITATNGDKEGTPVAVLEASAAGIPIVSTIHAGIPDVILHNETGLLCHEGDVEQMASNMLKLLDEPQLAKKMGAKGKKRILHHFNMSRHIKILQQTLESAISNA